MKMRKSFMISRLGLLLVIAVLAGSTVSRGQEAPAEAFWPQWRGPLATGGTPDGDPPVSWSEQENIRWKIPIPGRGSATPIVWGDKVFVLTAEPTGVDAPSQEGLFARLRRRMMGGSSPTKVLRFTVLALARSDGRVLWEQVAVEEVPHEGTHQTGTWASPSAVADAEQVCAFFGSRGLYCYDHAGQPLWQRDLGDLTIRLGFGEGPRPPCMATRSS